MRLEFDLGKISPLPNCFRGGLIETLKRSILALMIGQKDDVFKGEHDPEGTPWTPLSPKTIARRRNHQGGVKILQDTGQLKNSLTQAGAPYKIESARGYDVELGTNVPYARIHQYGGVIKTRHAEITIPARPFIGLGPNDAQEISEVVEGFMARNSK